MLGISLLLNFFKNIPVKYIIAGIVVLVVMAIIGLVYWHYTGLLDDVAELERSKATLEVTVQQQGDAIEAQKQGLAKWQEAQEELLVRIEELQSVATEAEAETRRLNALFSEHDLAAISRSKPGLVERRINDGTAAAFRLLECASGLQDPDCTGGRAPTPGTPASPEPETDPAAVR